MAGETRREARDNFLRPLQRAISCVSPAQLFYVERPGEVEALSVSEEPIRIASTTGTAGTLFLSVDHQYVVVEDARRDWGPWKVSTRAYHYRIDDAEEREITSWHWHPDGKVKYPHLHVRGARRLTKVHLPTSRVSVESIIRLLIGDLDARPQRLDWEEVLDEIERRLRMFWTWA